MDLYETDGCKLSSNSIAHKKKTLDKILDKSLLDVYFERAQLIQANDKVKLNLDVVRIKVGDAFELSNGDIKIKKKCLARISGATILQIQYAGVINNQILIYVNGALNRVFIGTSGNVNYSPTPIHFDCVLDLKAGDIISIYANPRVLALAIEGDSCTVTIQEL